MKLVEDKRNRIYKQRDNFLTNLYKEGLNDKKLDNLNRRIKSLDESLDIIKNINTVKKGR